MAQSGTCNGHTALAHARIQCQRPCATSVHMHTSLPQIHASGQLVMRDFVSMLPFTDELVLLELTGEQLLRSLETGVGSWPKLEGRFLQARAPSARVGCWRVCWGSEREANVAKHTLTNAFASRTHPNTHARNRCLAFALPSTPTCRPARACCQTL